MALVSLATPGSPTFADEVPGGAAEAAGGSAVLPSGLRAAEVGRLSRHPVWRRLLHVELAGSDASVRPAVVEPAFYLSDASPLSPRAELLATLAAFARAARPARVRGAPPAGSSPDDDPRCRYPARLQWLARMLPDSVGRLPAAPCPALSSWLDIDSVENVSLVHVSGYFANPASAFGHLLLRVGTEEEDGGRGLRDLGINFGADVPPGDGSLVYVFKGLTGGYDAGFSDQAFHVHDAVYSSTEQRDMWAYRLALDARQRALLLHHLWELSRARFRYYFLNRNCAWYLADLLELVLEQPLRASFTPWQLPRSVFETLDAIETADGEPLVESVTFVPSLERQFLHAFGSLDEVDARQANVLIAAGARAEVFEETLGDASTAVLDVLLDWADLGAGGTDGEARARWLNRKRVLLAERLRRPPGGAREPPPPLPPPARGPRSLTLAVGAVHDSEAASSSTLRLAPFAHDLLNANRGSLVDAALRILDLSLRLERGRAPRLRSLELLGIEKLAAAPVVVADRPNRIWRASMRINGERADCVNCSPVLASAGFGFANRSFADPLDLTLYAYADLELGSERSLAGPSVGALYRPDRHKAFRLEGRLRAASDGAPVRMLRLGAFAALPARYALAAYASRMAGSTRAGLEISRRF